MAWTMWKEINRRLRNTVGKAGSAHEIHINKSSASLHACLQDNNVLACCNDVLPMRYC